MRGFIYLLFNRKMNLYLALTMVIILAVFPGYAQNLGKEELKSSRVSLSADVIRKVYPNGLTLLIKPNCDNGVVSITLLVRMGTLYESPSQKGISSLMQRCLLYGGTATRDPLTIYDELESVGAYWNSASASDYGNIWLIVAKSGLDKALEVFFDIIRNPRFNTEDLEIGKNEKIQNIKTLKDQPLNTVSLVFNESFYGKHPYSWLTEGSIETVGSLQQEDLFKWYKKIYIPNNMVFTVVGNVNSEQIVKKFNNAFGMMIKRQLPKKTSQSIPKLKKDRTTIEYQNTQGVYLVLGYPAPGVLDDNTPAMIILNNLLSNRLYKELRDKRGLAYLAASSYQPLVGSTAIGAVLITAPENYRVAREGIITEYKKFCDEQISLEELQAAKKYLIGTYIMSLETGIAQGGLLGLSELNGHDYQYLDRYPELIEKVTAEDIQRVAKKYFKHYVLAVVAPEGTVEE